MGIPLGIQIASEEPSRCLGTNMVSTPGIQPSVKNDRYSTLFTSVYNAESNTFNVAK